MKIATWNVNSLKVRLPRVLEFLEHHAPEVVCLQETKTEAGRVPARRARRGGLPRRRPLGRALGGGRVLARDDLSLGEPASGLAGESAADEARWVEADVEGIRVVSTYVPNGREVGTETFDQKLAFFDAMAARAAELRGTPLVIAGDLNVVRADVDVYDPSAFEGATHVTPEERDRLERLLSDGDLADAYRAVHPDDVGYTWWDYRAGHFHKKLGIRIDYILASPEVAGRLTEVGIDRGFRKGTKPSDHAPLIAYLDGAGDGDPGPQI